MKKFRTFLLASAITFVGVASAFASALPIKGDPICDQAVSAAACASHKAYLASHPFISNDRDTSPYYMQIIDPRHNKFLLDAGGPSN